MPLLFACGAEDQEAVSDFNLHETMPFEGERSWEFISTDDELGWAMIAELRGLDETFTDRDVYLVDYKADCRTEGIDCEEGEILRTIAWSSDAANGVQLHAFMQGPANITYDPPIEVMPASMGTSTPVETVTDGFSWTSTLIGFEHCPTRMPQNWGAGCAHFVLEDGDGDSWSNEGLAGDYWAIAGQGIVAIQLEGSEHLWELSGAQCDDSDTCEQTTTSE
jgi:hypothetical protein